MSLEKYEEDCAGCRPAILDVKTGLKLSDHNPLMAAANAAWANASYVQRCAWHRVTCLNSRTPKDLELAHEVANLLQHAMSEVPR